MLTPSSVAAELMARAGVQRALVSAAPGSVRRFAMRKSTRCRRTSAAIPRCKPQYVGWHPDCTMKDIEAACQAIWAGARLYVASDVPFFATKQGRTMGYSYAIVGAIRRMTRAPMIVTGKPSLHALRFVASRLGLRRSNIGIVGDDPSVEIIMARRGGAKSFAVTTGVMTTEQWQQQSGLRRPDHVLRRLGDLLACVP